jgi:hypothetical protein
VHYLGGLKKCWVGAPHSHEGLGSVWGLVGGVWFVKMVWGVDGWCVVVCERENGQCEL